MCACGREAKKKRSSNNTTNNNNGSTICNKNNITTTTIRVAVAIPVQINDDIEDMHMMP
jgi:hypothetical protein